MTELRGRKTQTLEKDNEEDGGQNEPEVLTTRRFGNLAVLLTGQQLASPALNV